MTFHLNDKYARRCEGESCGCPCHKAEIPLAPNGDAIPEDEGGGQHRCKAQIDGG